MILARAILIRLDVWFNNRIVRFWLDSLRDWIFLAQRSLRC